MNFYQFFLPRLNGNIIESEFESYRGLVEKGVAGFIVFGGESGLLRKGIRELQALSQSPLIIASDLEQGLGQQVEGGTLLPPAAAVAQAESVNPGLAEKAFACIAREAKYAGINTVLAPVLDVDTNPDNPVIATRAFGTTPDGVSNLGVKMIRTFRNHGVISCGKHFPGHGGTDVDSHLRLPRIERTLEKLEGLELLPFKAAIQEGVASIMMGHLSVPALDSTGTPVSISREAVGYLRQAMNFSGIVMTDALNMRGLSGYTPTEAALGALDAGVDLLLHPSEPDELADSLVKNRRHYDSTRLNTLRNTLTAASNEAPEPMPDHELSGAITEASIVVEGGLKKLENPHLLILSDEGDKGAQLTGALKEAFPGMTHQTVTEAGEVSIPAGRELIVAVFSGVRGWKGGTAGWISDCLASVSSRTDVAISFGIPHIVNDVGKTMIKAWWDSPIAQLHVVKKFVFS